MKVKIGSVVALVDLDTGKEITKKIISKTYTYKPTTTKYYNYGILNEESAAIKEGNIPNDSEITELSPIGQKILGREVGYVFSIIVKNRVNYKIVKIVN